VGDGELVLVGVARCHGDLDPARRGFDQGADLEQLEANGGAGGAGQPGLFEPDAAQAVERDMGHGGGRGAVGEQVALALLDPVLHVAAGAIDVLVEGAGIIFPAAQGRDDEAGVGLAAGKEGRPFGLAHHPATPAPALARGPHEVGEAPRRPPGLSGFFLGPPEIGTDVLHEAAVARQAEQVVDAVRLAPGHQVLAREAAVRAQQNARVGPTLADTLGDPFHLLDRAGRGVDVGPPQLRR